MCHQGHHILVGRQFNDVDTGGHWGRRYFRSTGETSNSAREVIQVYSKSVNIYILNKRSHMAHG